MLERYENFVVVGEASDGLEALASARELMPDIILMDIRMPNCSGLAALKQLRASLPGISVVMLTVSEDDEDLFSAVKMGARGYLLKTIDAGELVKAIEQVSRGGAVVSPLMARKLLAEFAAMGINNNDDFDAGLLQLTAREKEILELIGQGLENKEIARLLYLAESTVKSHIRNIMEKLHIRNRAQAAAYAARSQLAAKRKTKRL